MPSPIGHSLAGYIIYRAIRRPAAVREFVSVLPYLVVANAPDLDFIPGFFVGDPNRYHHGMSHSVGFALLVSVAASFFLCLKRQASMGRNFSIVFCLYFSHIALDYLSVDSSAPHGVPLFWPLSDKFYIASFAFLPDVTREPFTSSSLTFILSFFSLHNLWTVLIELLLLLPVLFLVSGLRQRKRTE